jgi:hypothetical protein
MTSPEEPIRKPDPGVLRLKKNKSEHTPTPYAEREPSKKQLRKSEQKRKKLKENPVPGSKARLRFLLISATPFAMSVVILGTLLAHQFFSWEVVTHDQAIFARNVLIISFFVVLAIEAFTEDVLQGVLCLFLPPYSIIYGIFVADAGPIRGLTMAIVCFLGAEMFFTPNDAMVPIIQEKVNDFIYTNQRRLLDPYDD